jgi:hypothetical protein
VLAPVDLGLDFQHFPVKLRQPFQIAGDDADMSELHGPTSVRSDQESVDCQKADSGVNRQMITGPTMTPSMKAPARRMSMISLQPQDVHLPFRSLQANIIGEYLPEL